MPPDRALPRHPLVLVGLLALMMALPALPATASGGGLTGPVLLSGIDAGEGFSRFALWEKARDYAGREWRVGQFYQPHRPSHFLRLGVLVGLRPDLLVNASTYLDTGLDAPAMQADAMGTLSLTLIYLPRRNVTLSLGVRDLVQIGGRVREKPCRDDFGRAFHCGTARPWTDYQAVAPAFETPRRLFGRIEYRF